jgi:DNA-binding NarL/FixJ family response regulator
VTRLRIVLVEHHKVMREGLWMVVEKEAPMDISMPELNGLKATEALKRLIPEVKILILTRHMDSSYVQQLLRSGANG